MAIQHRLMPHDELAGRFRVVRTIGTGAMGVVYLAHRLGDGVPVALKVLRPAVAEDERARERFGREARVGDRIGHEHVVTVLDTGFDEATGLLWLSMEYLEGRPLADFLGQQPDWATRVRLLEHLFDAMAAAHRAGVIHRDLKPANLFVTDELILKVLDFGIAKILAPSLAASATEGGLGTPLWAAPEQGRGGSDVRPAVDVWSLGLLTFLVLTGKIYWRTSHQANASMLETAQEMLKDPIVVPSARAQELNAAGLPEGFDDWFMHAVVRDPDQRFPSADHARAALFPLLGLSAPAVAVAPPSMPLPTSPSRSPLRWVVVAIVMAAGLLAALSWWL